MLVTAAVQTLLFGLLASQPVVASANVDEHSTGVARRFTGGFANGAIEYANTARALVMPRKKKGNNNSTTTAASQSGANTARDLENENITRAVATILEARKKGNNNSTAAAGQSQTETNAARDLENENIARAVATILEARKKGAKNNSTAGAAGTKAVATDGDEIDD